MKNCFKSLETKSGRMDLLYSLLAIVIGIVFLFPLYWLVQISFKTDTETFGKVLTYFPRQITIDPKQDRKSTRLNSSHPSSSRMPSSA